MRVLNYATSDANPFHRDHRSNFKGYTRMSSKAIKANGTFSTISTLESSRSPQKWSRFTSECTETKRSLVIAYPPETVYASAKDTPFNDDSVLSEDTCSEMTVSVTTLPSSTSTAGNNTNMDFNQSRELVVKPMNPEAVRPHRTKRSIPGQTDYNSSQSHQSRSSYSCCEEKMTKGKFGGMTLQETLNWRRHASKDQNDTDRPKIQTAWKRGSKDTNAEVAPSPSQNIDPVLAAIRVSAKVKRHLALAKDNRIPKTEERKGSATAEFMAVRARLKRSKRKTMFESGGRAESILKVKNASTAVDDTLTHKVPFVQQQGSENKSNDTSACITTTAVDKHQLAREKLNSVFAKRFISADQSRQANHKKVAEANSIAASKGLEKDNASTAVDGNLFVQQQGLEHNSNDTSACITTTAVDKHQLAREKLNSVFAKRFISADQSRQANHKKVAEANSIAASKGHEQEMKDIAHNYRDFSQDASRTSQSPQDKGLADTKKHIHDKLNTILSLRKIPSFHSATTACSSFERASKEAKAVRDISECRDDIERDQRGGSERDPSNSLEDTSKYSKMLTMGIPVGAVKNCMIRDGVSPSRIFGTQAKGEATHVPRNTVEKAKRDPYRRTRLHWNEIEIFSDESIWQQIKVDNEMGKLHR